MENKELPFRGDRLKQLRDEKKLTQEELGKIINVTKVSISGYENGNRNPDIETLHNIADYFNVSSDYLMGRTDSKNGHSGEMYFLDLDHVTPEEIEEAKRYIEIRRKMLEDKEKD